MRRHIFVDAPSPGYDGRHTQPRGSSLLSSHYGSVPVQEHSMTTPPGENAHPDVVPLGQRLFDNMYLLLAAGLLVMLALYTGWGLWEITSLPAAPLP
jgi:hypothetical protein